MPSNTSVDHFKQSFREEAREILVELELSLLELGENPADMELVGRTFRALHTIKGSGAMFGFEELAAFTHNLENAYDEVRNGRLSVTAELVDLTLTALDQIKAMLEESGPARAGEKTARAAILEQVAKLTGDGAHAQAAAEAPPAAAVIEEGALRQWRIHFAPGPGLMASGSDPLILLRELGQLGKLTAAASMAAVPSLAELEPERCYVAWDLTLETAASLDTIRDVFIFAEDLCELELEPAPMPAAIEAEDREPAPGGDQTSAAETAALALRDPRSSAGRRDYDKPDSASSIRVPAAKLDQFVDLVGELVTVQARLSEIASRHADADVAAVSEEIERLTAALRENSMNIRMLPIRATFERFRRLVHDLARDLGKDVELTIEGADTELDKTVIDQLGDPLMHLIRNSMDHGIEPAAVRATAGKRATAKIRLAARHSGASVLIAVTDDGGGIDAAAVRNRAVERGLVAPDAQLSEAATFALLFEPGFSTAKKVTDVSGRGVGMDVVRKRVEGLRGSIEVASKPGAGTSVTLRLPLTLAIIDGLLVKVGEAYFVLPLANTLECIELTPADIAAANGRHVANVRGELIPYLSLRQHFSIRARRPEIEQIMVVETEEGRFGFVVDQVLGDYQTVIKNLGRFYRQVQVVSGATILGNGTVALILDPERLVQDAMRPPSAATRGHPRARPGPAGACAQ